MAVFAGPAEKCSICGKETIGEPFRVTGPLINEVVCSPSCLVELSWKLKEQQAKMSKSKPKEYE